MENDSRTSLKQEMEKGFFFPGTTEVLMEKDSRPTYRNPCVAAPSKPRCTSTDEDYGGLSHTVHCGPSVREGMIRMAKQMMFRSLVVVAVHQGDKELARLPGIIIRSDGVVATCASGLSFRTIKGLRVTGHKWIVHSQSFQPIYDIFIPKQTVDLVKVLGERVTHEGALLDADFSSKFTFIKFKSPGQQRVPTFAKAFGTSGVAVGCTGQGPKLRDIGFNYLPALMCVVNENENKQSHAMTFGRVIQAFPEGAVGCTSQGPELRDSGFYLPALICGVVNENENKQSPAMTSRRVISAFPQGVPIVDAEVLQRKWVNLHKANFIGGALVNPMDGLQGLIHYQYCSEIKATPMDDVLKYLEHLENSSPFQLHDIKVVEELHDIKVVEEEGYLAGKLDSPATTITTTKSGSNRLPRITTANPRLLLLLFLCFFVFCRLLSCLLPLHVSER